MVFSFRNLPLEAAGAEGVEKGVRVGVWLVGWLVGHFFPVDLVDDDVI
jgi:hypothetical protein